MLGFCLGFKKARDVLHFADELQILFVDKQTA